MKGNPKPFRLGTSTFICQGWLAPDHVSVIDASPVVSVEVASPEMWEAPTDEVHASLSALRASNLECWSVHSPFGGKFDLSSMDDTSRQDALQALSRAFDLASSLGCQAVVVHPSIEPIDPRERPKRMERARRSLENVVEIARESGIPAALEPLPRTCLGNTAEEMATLLEGLPARWMGICLDVNHANLGQDLIAFIHRFNTRIISLHISDNDGIDERHWLPGEGIINWPGVINALGEVGHDGPFIYEVGLGDVGLAERLAQFGENHASLMASAR